MSPRRPNTARRPLGALNPDYCARPFSARAMRRTVGYLSARRPRGGSRRAPHPEGGTNRPTGENGSIADPFFGVQPLYLSDPCGGRGVPLCAEQRAGGDCSARTFCYLSLLGVSNCASQNQGTGTAGNRAYFGWGVDCLRVALSFIVPTSGDPQSLGVRPEWAGRNFLGDCLGHGRMRIRARALNWGKGARAGLGSVVGGGWMSARRQYGRSKYSAIQPQHRPLRFGEAEEKERRRPSGGMREIAKIHPLRGIAEN